VKHNLPPLHYHDYLKLDAILNSQKTRSKEIGHEAHDETLFIIIHQVYELWFKQLLHELSSIHNIFVTNKVAETHMGLIVARLERMGEIFKLLIDQIRVLETMTPLDFLDFRDFLFPASGFQSFQFRRLEVLLGLKSKQRLPFSSQPYTAALRSDQSKELTQLEEGPSLFDAVEDWLERTPFLNLADFDFWNLYRTAVSNMLRTDQQTVTSYKELGPEEQARNIKIIHEAEQMFKALFDEQEFEKSRLNGTWRLSMKALHAALFIQVYRDQPVLQQPFRLLMALINLDELFTNWRYRHAVMAKRMLGTKIGTGGSSGSDYLTASADQHRIFQDFNRLTTFFIPRSQLPVLPSTIERELGFYYSAK
jgi:tryptophan 2,3-dioxygenase